MFELLNNCVKIRFCKLIYLYIFLYYFCTCSMDYFVVCSGTANGISTQFGKPWAETLEYWRSLYTSCTLVDGNLELVGIPASALESDLNFLMNITEVCNQSVCTRIFCFQNQFNPELIGCMIFIWTKIRKSVIKNFRNINR